MVPLGPNGLGPSGPPGRDEPPLALMGWALIGHLEANGPVPMGPLGPHRLYPMGLPWGVMGWALMALGPIGPG